jgi:uncharacterized membrane protein
MPSKQSAGRNARRAPIPTAKRRIFVNTVYLLLKFVHVAAVIAWVGGVFALIVLNARAANSGDAAARAALGRQSESFGRTVLGPAMGITLLAGIATAGSIGYPFSALWIVWGVVGLVLSILIGVVAVRRAAEELGALARSAGPDDPRVAAVGRRLASLNWLNLLVLVSVVWAMVFKPML